MLTGEPPFKGEYEQSIIYAILNNEPDTLKEVPANIQEVVSKSLAKTQGMRWKSMEEIISCLKGGAGLSAKSSVRLHSIAVLPFANMSADPEQEYFCDGIAEEIINALTHIDTLTVIARTSAFSFKDKNIDIREIGKKLEVEHLLEGSVRKSGNQLRIMAQLINARDGSHIWSERFDRNMDDIFAIQDEIALAIVDKLKVELGEDEKESIEKRYTENIDSYNHYLKGRYFWNMRSEESLEKAIVHFQKALQSDDTYALAYTGLADAYNLIPWYSSKMPHEICLMAKQAALNALKIDETLAEAHISLAFTLMFNDWNWPNSEIEFKKGIELKPGYATGHHWYFEYLVAVGQLEKALDEIHLAWDLDPLSLIINSAVGWAFYFNRKYDKAIEQSKKTLEMDTNFLWANYIYRISCLQKSEPEEVIDSGRSLPIALKQHPLMQATLGSAYALMGNRTEAGKVSENLKNLAKEKYISPCLIAMIHVYLNENDQALKLLEEAFKYKDFWLVFLNTDPIYDGVREKLVFKALLKKIGLK
jgi:serine/threonine-protein kinase